MPGGDRIGVSADIEHPTTSSRVKRQDRGTPLIPLVALSGHLRASPSGP